VEAGIEIRGETDLALPLRKLVGWRRVRKAFECWILGPRDSQKEENTSLGEFQGL
jgi:hypothetical protein